MPALRDSAAAGEHRNAAPSERERERARESAWYLASLLSQWVSNGLDTIYVNNYFRGTPSYDHYGSKAIRE